VTARARIVAWLDGRQANVAWKLMALAALVMSLFIAAKQYEMTGCQARYNEASNISQRARSEAATVDRVALDKLLVQVAEQPHSAIVAIRQYNQSRADADRQRAANPVPPSPSETCG
jgi:hypothetical protein